VIAIPANVSIFVIHESVSFACGIDGMRGHCIALTKNDPMERGNFLFVNKSRTQTRVIWYDGQGFLMATKRLSHGSFKSWPKNGENIFSLLESFQAQGLLFDGNPSLKNFHPVWRKNIIK